MSIFLAILTAGSVRSCASIRTQMACGASFCPRQCMVTGSLTAHYINSISTAQMAGSTVFRHTLLVWCRMSRLKTIRHSSGLSSRLSGQIVTSRLQSVLRCLSMRPMWVWLRRRRAWVHTLSLRRRFCQRCVVPDIMPFRLWLLPSIHTMVRLATMSQISLHHHQGLVLRRSLSR